MKSLLRAVTLWLVLGGLSYLLARTPHDEALPSLAAGALFVIPALAVCLTARAAATLPGRWPGRIGFWVVTVASWSVLLLLMQGRAEASAYQRQFILAALGLVGLAIVWFGIKTRSLPSRRVVGEVAAAVALVALAVGGYAWSYDARTRSIVARAEARWSEIGLPMTEFEKTLAPTTENAGSEVVRQVLRAEVNSLFYKHGTRAAEREPAIQPSEAISQVIKGATELLSVKLPPSDDLDLSAQSLALLEPAAETLDADYRRILGVEPASWASDPHDGFFISVPNLLGVRKLAQLTAADSLRRFSIGDQEGATRALAAGLRLRDGLLQNPTLVSLMMGVSVDGLLSSKQVRLPASEVGLASLAGDVTFLRAGLIRRLQIDAWVGLRMASQNSSQAIFGASASIVPGWAARTVYEKWVRRQLALGALTGAEHVAIQQAPATLALPDFGASLHQAVSEANPTVGDINCVRASMRIHLTLLLREQTELIREARARLAAGQMPESRDSVVLPGLRWELLPDLEKGTVATRLLGAPEWIVKNDMADNDFWLLPLDGSVAWQFRRPVRTAGVN